VNAEAKGLLVVREPGAHTTVQDAGRFGWQRLGVPPAGALDAESLHLANALVGNPPGAAALECLHRGPTLVALARSVRIALAGADCALELEGGERVPAWRSVTLEHGQWVRVDRLGGTACAYLSVAGGFALPPVLGSHSTYARARLGGLEGRALDAGDRLPLAFGRAPEGPEQRLAYPPEAGLDRPVRVIPGPQDALFDEHVLEAFFASAYTVSAHSDRMGLRLDGPPVPARGAEDFVSDAIATGAIQVPGSGQPIVLLADHQTTGGYPKIATVIAADVPLVARRRPGDPIGFQAVSLEAATAARERAAARLAVLAGRPRAAGARGRLDPALLRRENLASGFFAAPD